MLKENEVQFKFVLNVSRRIIQSPAHSVVLTLNGRQLHPIINLHKLLKFSHLTIGDNTNQIHAARSSDDNRYFDLVFELNDTAYTWNLYVKDQDCFEDEETAESSTSFKSKIRRSNKPL